jgi:hypothetical protein
MTTRVNRVVPISTQKPHILIEVDTATGATSLTARGPFTLLHILDILFNQMASIWKQFGQQQAGIVGGNKIQVLPGYQEEPVSDASSESTNEKDNNGSGNTVS